LESAKAQSYKNIELIVTDDCSQDDTVRICRKWIEENITRFAHIELVSAEKNTGIAANCNRGAEKARGKWLKFIAGDDILMENCIEDNLSFANNNPDAKFITSKMHKINEDGILLNNEESIYEAYEKHYFSKPASQQQKIYARLPIFLNSPAFFIKKDVLINVGYFDDQFKIYDDICLIFRMHSINVRVFYNDAFTIKYRTHENAISRSTNHLINSRRNEEQLLIFKKYRIQHLNKLNLIDLAVYYETWLQFKFKGFFGHKALMFLLKLSGFYWYLKYLDLKSRLTNKN
jgi:alpha-1,3-rhamnosyltransferase